MYVARVKEVDGKFIYFNSKPCTLCIQFMHLYGITHVYYTTGDSNCMIVKMKISDMLKEPQFVTSLPYSAFTSCCHNHSDSPNT